MWLFTEHGHLSIGQHSSEPDYLVVHSRMRGEMDKFVALLDEAAGKRHEVQETVEGGYRFLVMARRPVVAEAVAKMIAAIDYGKVMHSVSFDFGEQPGFLLLVGKNGLQVAIARSQGAA
jgi:hypothetical protein